MTARPHYDPQAGEWVAFLVVPARRYCPNTHGWVPVRGTSRAYLRVFRGAGRPIVTEPSPQRWCVRFDTEAEALAVAAVAWPRADPTRLGAARVTKDGWLARAGSGTD